MGLTYLDGTLAGHAWNEVWVGDWYALDATIATGSVDATHVTLSVSDLAGDGGALDLFGPLAAGLGRFEVEILEAAWGEREFDLHDPQSYQSFAGDLYRNDLYAIALRKPPGWSFDAKPPSSHKLLELDAPEGGGEIEIHGMALPPGLDFGAFRDLILAKENIEGVPEEVSVDGRQAWKYPAGRDGEQRVLVLVENDGVVYGFQLDARGPEAEQAFREVLRSVDLDAREPPR
jgi:hypothetical protein